MKKPAYFLSILLFLSLIGIKSVEAQVQVKLQQPPPNQLHATDIWNLTLTNTTGKTLTVIISGKLEEAGEGIVVDGTSKPFSLPPGTKRITYDDVKSGSVNFKSGKWREAFTRTGNAPSGDYTICIYVKSEEGEELGSDCIEQKVEITGAPQLVFPADGDEILPGTLPTFTWLPPMPTPQGAEYTLKIVEIIGNQSPEAAMNMNKAFFERKGIKTTMFQYPGSEKKFEEGRKYAWVISTGELKSEIFSFSMSSASCGTIVDSIKVECMGWDENTGLPQYLVTILLTNIPTSPTYGCNATYTSIATLPANTGTITGINTIPLTITPNNSGSIQFTYSPPNLSTTSVTFGVFGTWADDMNNTVNLSTVIDTLPSCLCNDCDSASLSAEQVAVSNVSGNPNQYNISGSLAINGLPANIQVIEIQVKSFSFTSVPVSCSNGIQQIEHSGVMINPSTTINSVVPVFQNVMVPNNYNASKDIKWIVGGSGLTQPASIPFNLTLGVPAPLPGLPADCCTMDYTVCFKVIVYYGSSPDVCRYCEFYFCKTFSNN
jgi:hypothetical protein